MDERVVEVDKEWYAALCEYLHPVERMVKDVWTRDIERTGIVFYVPNPERTSLVFVPREKADG